MTTTAPTPSAPTSQVREAPVADWVSIPELYTDPFPTFERLRAEGGVHWVPAANRYLITSYAAVHATELDQEVFSADEEGSLMKRAMGHPMLRKDDPEHHPERRAYMPTLKPATVKKVWTRIFHEQAERYLAEFRAKGPGADLVWDFAAPYTAETLRAVTGLHNVTGDDLQRWSQCLIDATGNYAEDPEVWARGRQAFEEVDAAIDEMIPWHLAHPDHSLLSFPEYRMPLESIRSNLKMTIGGGLNEPRDAIGVAAWALLADPEQRRLAVEGNRWHEAFDEGIRWIAPIGLYSRQTTRETVLEGVRLPAGARLGICLLSANRDEHEWPHPERYDLTRTGQGAHLAFGKGVHNCAGAWVARAQVADVALPLLFRELPTLRLNPEDPAMAGGWVFRGMDRLPVLWDEPASGAVAATTTSPAAGTGRHVAIVGAGPAGSFTAQALRKALPGAEVTVFDGRPAPFGLVRAGVAPDHQGTKAVAEQFSALYADGGVRFVGSTKVRRDAPDEDVVLSGKPGVFGPALRSQDAAGAELGLDQLREAFDAVVLAPGLDADRSLGVPGAELDGVLGAGSVTRWLNGDPDETAAALTSRLGRERPLGETAAVVGMGNVALDVVRLLAKDAAALEGSDVHDAAHTHLTDGLRTLHVVGRSAPQACAFDPVMLREIADVPGVRHEVHGVDPALLAGASDADPRLDAVRALAAGEAGGDDEARVRVHWWFGRRPVEVLGEDAVAGLRVSPTDAAGEGAGAAVGEERPEATTDLDVAAVITAIGFDDRDDALLPQAAVDEQARATGRIEPGLYVAGWARRGPRGTIPSQRTDSRELAALITADLAEAGQAAVSGAAAGEATPQAPATGRRRALRGIAAVRPYLSRATGFDGWLRIDRAERAEAEPGRRRRKITDARRQRLLAAGAWERPVRGESGGAGTADDGAPKPALTVLYGTESGNAEVAAEAIAARLAGRFAVTVQDLADTDPAALSPAVPVVAVCSTYGDGELPTSARGFAARLAEGARLDGVRFAAFGLGDRTYGATYSHGVDLLTAALEAAGAEHVLDTGRHDAATGRPTADAAGEWADGVAEELVGLVVA